MGEYHPLILVIELGKKERKTEKKTVRDNYSKYNKKQSWSYVMNRVLTSVTTCLVQ